MTSRLSSKANFDMKNDNSHNNEDEVMSELVHNIDDFLYIVQSSSSATTTTTATTQKQNNDVYTPELLASSDINTCKTTLDDHEINKKREAHQMPFENQNQFQLPNQNRRNDDDREEIEEQAKRSPDPTTSSSVENLIETDNHDSFVNNLQSCRNNAFPQVLHAILKTSKDNGYGNIISWQNHGQSFRVDDKDTFVSTVMPRYFNQTRYTSFQRQLALYGFVRLTNKKSDDFGSYYHKKFLRGYPNLACMIQRTAVKGTTGQQKLVSSTETKQQPDYHATIESIGIDDGVFNYIDDSSNQITSTQDDSIQTEEEVEGVMSELFCNIDEFLSQIQCNDVVAKELIIASNCDIICLATDDDHKVSNNKQIEKIATIVKKTDKKSSCSTSNSSIPNNSFVTIVLSKNIAFPQILHAMLRTSKENGYDDIFSWQHHGRSFRIEDVKTFVTTIIPRYFNQTRYSSFRRQLLLYGFVRFGKNKSSEDYGSYYHVRFLRGHPNLACMIQRKGGMKGLQQLLLSPETTKEEPDFQTMGAVGVEVSDTIDDDDNKSEQKMSSVVANTKVRSHSCSYLPSHHHSTTQQQVSTNNNNVFAISSLYKCHSEGDMKSAKQQPNHQYENLPKRIDSYEKHFQNASRDTPPFHYSTTNTTMIDGTGNEAIDDNLSMSGFLSDVDL